MRRLAAPVLQLALALLIPVLPAGAGVKPPDDKDAARWVRLDTTAFTVLTDAGPAAATATAEDLERLRLSLAHMTRLKAESQLPMLVYAFRDAGEFTPYREALMPGRERISGVFLAGSLQSVILLQHDAVESGHAVVQHELIHYFLHRNFANVPVWFNEGLAEFYSTFAQREGKVEIGRPIPHHVFLLRDTKLLPLADLFRVGKDSPDYNEDRRAGIFYAQSWALVHYLILGNPERRQGLGRFLDAMAAGTAVDPAFAAAFPEGYDALAKELRSYVHQHSFRFATEPASSDLPAFPDPQPIGAAEARRRLGDLLAHRGKIAEAEQHYQAALKTAPDDAEALAGIGRLRSLQGETAAALALHQQAVAAKPVTFAPYLGLADLLLKDACARLRKASAGSKR